MSTTITRACGAGRVIALHERRRRAGGPIAEVALGDAQRLGRIDVAREDQGRVARPPARPPGGLEVGARDRGERRFGAAGGVAIFGLAEERARRDQVGDVAGIVERDPHRIGRDRALPFELLGGQGRVAGDVGDQVDRGADVGAAHGEAELRAVPAGAAGERGAERFGGGVDLRRPSGLPCLRSSPRR